MSLQVFLRLPFGSLVPFHVRKDASSDEIFQAAMKVASSLHPISDQISLYLHGSRIHTGMSICGTKFCSGDTFEMMVPLRGGGGDGGATGAESRDCYLSMYLDKKPDKVDPNEARIAKWTRCRVSAAELNPPCVIDYLGNIYNKDALIESLVSKSIPTSLRHIKGLKDIMDIHLTENPAWSRDDGDFSSRFHCPVTGQEFSGLFKFVALKGCGHVLSLRAFKEVKGSACLVCYKPFTEEDKITINGSDEEVEELRLRIEKAKASHKSKKKEKIAGLPNGDVDGANLVAHSGAAENTDMPLAHKRKIEAPVNGNHASIPLVHAAAATAAAVVRPKGSDLVELPKKFKAGEHLPKGATRDVYSSIFVSSRKEKFKETYSCRNLPIGRN